MEKKYRIKIKDPTRENQILYFTTRAYELGDNTITFIDRDGRKQVWHINQLINIEETELNGGEQ